MDFDKPPGDLPLDAFDLRTAKDSQREVIEHFERLYGRPANPWTQPGRLRSERPNIEPPEINDDTLEKRYDAATSSGRNRAATREFVRASLARGKTITSLAAHARRGGNSELARLIEEVGDELAQGF